jgi:beta-glucanase (GH16 family)
MLTCSAEKNPDDHQITHLALRTNRNKNFSSSGELKSLLKNVYHASIRVNARVRGDPGAVAGLFTYFNDSTESDIEILTRDPATQIHYTNQPSTDAFGHAIVAAESTQLLPHHGVWTDWTRHRLDWLPNLSAWYANDLLLAKTTYGVPQSPSYLTINMVCQD